MQRLIHMVSCSSVLVEQDHLKIPLYHGTSTLFLESILDHGLGAKNPIEEWKFYELAKEILPLCEQVKDSEIYTARINSFRQMVEQKTSKHGFNFQHGETYLSPSLDTAVRYATNKRYGSEFMTYTLDFLDELQRRNVPGVRTDLFKRFGTAFNFLDVSPAPILIELWKAPVSALRDEKNNDPKPVLEAMEKTLLEHPELAAALNQQRNFRLKSVVAPERLKIFLINVIRHNNGSLPKFSLFELQRQGSMPRQ